MRQNYATHLTRDYLEFLGITNVTEDGKIFTKDGEIIPYPRKDGYTQIALYSPTIRQSIAPKERTAASGQIILCTHRVVYVWFNRIQPDGLVIHHKDSNRANNHISNLQLETPGNNIWMDRVHDIKEIKCKLNRPRTYYEEKLAKYEALYEEAKANRDAAKAHALRSNISQVKARLRYWDSHKDEIALVIAEKEKHTEEEAARLEAKRQSIKDRKILEQYKLAFKEVGNKKMWHEVTKVIKAWDSLEEFQKTHIWDVLNRFSRKEQKDELK